MFYFGNIRRAMAKEYLVSESWLLASELRMYRGRLQAQGTDSRAALEELGFRVDSLINNGLFYLVYPPEGWTKHVDTKIYTYVSDETGKMRVYMLDSRSLQQEWPDRRLEIWLDIYSI